MDPITVIGLAASIIQLIDTTTKTLGWLNEMKNAPKERATLAMELTSLLTLLTILRYQIEDCKPDGSWFAAIRFLGVKNGPVEQLASAIDDIRQKLCSTGPKVIQRVLFWPYTHKEIQNHLSRVERLKSLINLAYQKDLSQLVLAIKSDTAVIANLGDEMKNIAEKMEKLRGNYSSDRYNEEQKKIAKERQAMVSWVSPLNFFPVQEDILNKWQEGTCGWLFNSETFEKWSSKAGNILWCWGIPGAGKTVFTSAAAQYLRRNFSDDSRVGIAVVYCNYKEQFQQTIVNLLAGIWRQLVQTESISNNMSLIYKTHKERGTALSQWEITEELRSRVRRFQRCFILVDALDECSEVNNTRFTLVRVLRSLLAKANILFTSRPFDSIKSELRSSLTLEIRASQNDVAKYVHGRIAVESRLRRHIGKDPELGEEIVRKVSSSTQKMFLLAQLQMDSLAYQGTRRALENALAKLPIELDRIYDEALSRIAMQHEYDRELAYQIISMISFAYRPLTCQELQHALAIEFEKTEFDHKNVPDEELITSVCAGLVVIEQANQSVMPIHYTTQEYFERVRNLKFPATQRMITGLCLTYLSYNCFLPRETLKAISVSVSPGWIARNLSEYRFLGYAVIYWTRHLMDGEILDEYTENLLWKFLNTESQLLNATRTAQTIDWQSRIPRDASGLQVAVIIGHCVFVERFIQEKANINYQDFDGETALHLATKGGHDEIALAILEGSPKVNLQDKYGITALHIAARQNKLKLAKLLKQRGADGTIKDSWGQSSLHYAASGGDVNFVRWILEDGSQNVNEADRQGRLPLHYAASNGHAGVVDLLMANGSEHSRRDTDDRLDSSFEKRQGQTALHLAAEAGDEKVIELLVQVMSDLNMKDGDGYTALYIAILNGHTAAAELLIKKGAEQHPNLVRQAAEVRNRQMMELLLRECKNIDINAEIPLCITASLRDAPMTRLLLRMRSDIDVNKEGRYGKTPLHLATESKSVAVMQILIDAGANTEVRNHYGETALHRAAELGYVAGIRLLFEAGAKLNVVDRDGETPLHRAVSTENLQAVDVLLKSDQLDLSLQDYKGDTVLHVAAKRGNLDMVHKLFIRRPLLDIFVEDRQGLTPLDWASHYEHVNIVSFLRQTRRLQLPDETL